MQIEMQYVDNVAEKLNLSRDEILRESLKFYLEKIIREIKTDIFKIRTKYGVLSIEDLKRNTKKVKLKKKIRGRNSKNLITWNSKRRTGKRTGTV